MADPFRELPNEMVFEVAKQIGYPEVLQFCASSYRLSKVCQTDFFWSELYDQTFGKKDMKAKKRFLARWYLEKERDSMIDGILDDLHAYAHNLGDLSEKMESWRDRGLEKMVADTRLRLARYYILMAQDDGLYDMLSLAYFQHLTPQWLEKQSTEFRNEVRNSYNRSSRDFILHSDEHQMPQFAEEDYSAIRERFVRDEKKVAKITLYLVAQMVGLHTVTPEMRRSEILKKIRQKIGSR